MNLRHDVCAVDEDRRPPRRAKRHVQNRPILGGVNLFSAKHRFDAGLQTNLTGEFDQQDDCLVGNSILGIVEIDADGFRAHPLGATGVVLEQRPQMETFNLFVVAFERLPCREGNQRRQGRRSATHGLLPVPFVPPASCAGLAAFGIDEKGSYLDPS